MSVLDDSLLGKNTVYVASYAPHLLYPIPRALKRGELGISDSTLPFRGEDVWTAYEVSWLNPKGKPLVAMVEFRFDCASTNIIESKSFKLYLNSLNQTRFASQEALEQVLVGDLTRVADGAVGVTFGGAGALADAGDALVRFACLDELDIEPVSYVPSPEVLQMGTGKVKESLVSHLLKTNCPVTGQPDWASVFIDYRGPAIVHESLLHYLISFREHQDFHEQCVERIFQDLMHYCQPEALTLYARYTRRGGLDINPFRSTEAGRAPEGFRLLRQ